jgi:tetratricopeptide (TPR) repeat protein
MKPVGDNSGNGWMRTVEAARSLGDVDRCIEALRLGLENSAGDAANHLFAGEAYSSLGFYLEALQNYDLAARLAPQASAVALESLLAGAALLAELGFYDEAATRFDAARVLDGQNSSGQNLQPGSTNSPAGQSNAERSKIARELAALAIRAARFEEPASVQELLERSVDIQETPEARFELARFCLAQGQPARALEHLEKGRLLDPSNATFQNLAARCYMAMGQEKSARDAAMRAELLGDRTRAGRVLRFEAKSWAVKQADQPDQPAT